MKEKKPTYHEDMKFLEENNFKIEYEKDYTDGEFLKILEDLYFQETSFVILMKTKLMDLLILQIKSNI